MRWLVLLILLAGAYYLFGGADYAKHVYGTVDISLSPTSVRAGQSFTVTISASGVGGLDFLCIDSSSIGSYGNCNSVDGRCIRSCWPYNFSTYFFSSPNWYEGVQFFGNGGKVLSTTQYEYYSGPTQADSGGADFALFPSTYNGNGSGFYLPAGSSVRLMGSISVANGTFVYSRPVVGICYNTAKGTPTITENYGWSYWRTTSGSWWGKSWACKLYTYSGGVTSKYFDFRVTAPSTSDAEFYLTASSQCFYDSAGCGSIQYIIRVNYSLADVTTTTALMFEPDGPSGVSFSPACYWGKTSSYSFTGSTSSSMSAGTYAIDGYVASFTLYYMFLAGSSYYVACGIASDTTFPEYVGSDRAYLTVSAPASAVYLYSYGSNSGSPAQEPDDHYLMGRVYVSGGTIFDYVDVYLDGTRILRYYSSDMTCGTSYCYKDFTYNMQGKSDGSHTLEARLYVDGSLKDTDTKTFYYYQVGVRNVTASQAGNDRVSVSFEYKGGHKSLLIYLDTESCVVYRNTSFAPSSAHNWAVFGPNSYTIPSCARSPGTHTLGVKLCDESGLCATDTTTVNFEFTYSYSVTLDAPTPGVKHLSTDQRGAPPSTYSEPFTISYSTDDPSATLKLLVNSSTVQSWSITGSGVKTGSVPANYLQCGDTEFKAELSGSSGSDQSSAVVTYVCWYASIESPVGVVDVPSSDNATVNDGMTLTLLGITDETPELVAKVVNAYLDGSPLSPVSCPSGYTDCFAVPVGGLACGSTHTLRLEVGDGATVYSYDEEVITLNCVQRYVDIVSPADGSEFDYNVPLSEVNIDVYVNYAGGDSLTFALNGSPVALIESNEGCAYSACYILPGTELLVGPNTLEVNLLSSGTVVASDSVAFTVYLWQFVPGEDWERTPPILYLEEHGSHPDACYVLTDDNMYDMVYDSAESLWLLTIDETWEGATVNIFCSKDARIVYDINYTVQGPGVQPATPVTVTVGGGGVVAVKPAKEVPYPVFPEREQAANYIYSLYHYKGKFPSDLIKDVYISQSRLCVVPTGKVPNMKIEYYLYNFETFPEDDVEARQIIASLGGAELHASGVTSTGSEVCVDIGGTGLARVTFADGSEYYVFVLDVAEVAAGFNLSVIAVLILVAILIWYMMSRGAV